MAAIAAASALSVFAEGAPPQSAQPTSTVPVAGGWTARFYVKPTAPSPGMAGEPLVRHDAEAGVNARFSKRLWRGTRLDVDVVNVFDREAPFTPGFLAVPSAGRGIRFSLRSTF